MTVKRYLNNIFKIKKSISIKNPVAHFILRITANQRFWNLCCLKVGTSSSLISKLDVPLVHLSVACMCVNLSGKNGQKDMFQVAMTF